MAFLGLKRRFLSAFRSARVLGSPGFLVSGHCSHLGVDRWRLRVFGFMIGVSCVSLRVLSAATERSDHVGSHEPRHACTGVIGPLYDGLKALDYRNHDDSIRDRERDAFAPTARRATGAHDRGSCLCPCAEFGKDVIGHRTVAFHRDAPVYPKGTGECCGRCVANTEYCWICPVSSLFPEYFLGVCVDWPSRVR